MSMSFAVIMPCLNQCEYTRQAVDSLTATVGDSTIHFIFIDNGSTDDTPRYLATVPNSTVIRNEENIYVNPAWNQGLKEALRGDYSHIIISNNDIIARPGWVESFKDRDFNGKYYVPIRWGLTEDTPMHLWTWSGWFMVYTREQAAMFYPIPETIKINYGDLYIDAVLHSKGQHPHALADFHIEHFGKTSRLPTMSQVLFRDHIEFSKIVKASPFMPQNFIEFRLRILYFN